VVCFTIQAEALTMDMIRSFLAAVRDDGQVFFTPTIYGGIPAIRAAVSNWLTEKQDADVAIAALKRVYARHFAPKTLEITSDK